MDYVRTILLVEVVGFFVSQADFFVTYILTTGLSGFSLEILQPGLLIWDLLRSCICCSGKEKDAYLYSLPHFRIIPFVSLLLLIGMVYAVVAPLLLPFLIGYFCLGYVIYVIQVDALTNLLPQIVFLFFHVLVYYLYRVMHLHINMVLVIAWLLYPTGTGKNWFLFEHWRYANRTYKKTR